MYLIFVLWPSSCSKFSLHKHFVSITVVIVRELSRHNSFWFCRFCLLEIPDGILLDRVAGLLFSSRVLSPLFVTVVFLSSFFYFFICTWFRFNLTDGTRYDFYLNEG